MPARIVKTYTDESTDSRILQVWARNWHKHGWATLVLSHWDARRSKSYRDEISPADLKWLAFSESHGGLLVSPEVLVQDDFDFPPADKWGAVSLSAACHSCAVLATTTGAEELVWDVLAKRPPDLSKIAELCVEAGSSDAELAPLVHFSHQACKKHNREKIQWMKEFSGKVEDLQKIC